MEHTPLKNDERIIKYEEPIKKESKVKGIILKTLLIVIAVTIAILYVVFFVPRTDHNEMKEAVLYYIGNDNCMYNGEGEKICEEYSTYITSSGKLDRHILFDKNTKQLSLYIDGKSNVIDNNVSYLYFDKEINKVVYIKTEGNGLQSIFMWDKENRLEIARDLYKITGVNVSLRGSYFSFCAKDANGIYKIYSVSPSGETKERISSEFMLASAYISESGDIVYYSSEKDNYIYDKDGKQTFFAEKPKHLIVFENCNQYLWLSEAGQITFGTLGENDEKLIATDIEQLYEVGGENSYVSCDSDLKVNIRNKNFVSSSKNPQIIYYKDKNYYYKDLNQAGESEKIMEDVIGLQQYSFVDTYNLFYLDSGSLYKREKRHGKWREATKIAQNLNSFDTFLRSDDLVYLTDKGELYYYMNEKSIKIAEEVTKYCISENSTSIAYLSKGQAYFIKALGPPAKELDIEASEVSAMYCLENYYVYLNSKNELIMVDTNSKRRDHIAQNVLQCNILWK